MKLRNLNPHRNAKYIDFVKRRPCLVTGTEDPELVAAHHVRCLGGGGTGLKPSDYMCLPLLHAEHAKLHQIGEERYWQMKGLDPEEMILMHLLIYLCSAEDRQATACQLTEIVEASRQRSHPKPYRPPTKTVPRRQLAQAKSPKARSQRQTTPRAK